MAQDTNEPSLTGRRIKELRMRRGLSRTKLGAASGVPPGYIRDLEKGRQQKIQAARAEDLARPLGTHAGYLVGTSSQEQPPASSEEHGDGALRLEVRGRNVSLFSLEKLDWVASGKKLNGERSIVVFDERENLAGFELTTNALDREMAPGSVCVVDLDDKLPVDGEIFVFRLNQKVDVRVYRDRNGPPRLEADSHGRFDTIFLAPGDDFHIIGRVIEYHGKPRRRG